MEVTWAVHFIIFRYTKQIHISKRHRFQSVRCHKTEYENKEPETVTDAENGQCPTRKKSLLPKSYRILFPSIYIY
jgi:hypothetical protein